MSDSQVFRNISVYLRQVLLDGLSGSEGSNVVGTGSISLDSPERLLGNGGGNNTSQSQALLSLYLYQVTPNAHLNNQPLISNGNGQQNYPPLSLNLFYLLTPLGATPEQDLLILGRVMQLFAAVPIIQAAFLDSHLRPATPAVRLLLNPLSLEELTRIWNAFNQPYRLSVAYQVQVVSIDNVRLSEDYAPVFERLLDVQQIMATPGGDP